MQTQKNIILIDKPSKMTSFDVIRELRKRTDIKKWGHAGTLDPQASGLLILGCNGGTKRRAEYVGLNKEYIAEVLIGIKTTTGDLDGEVIEEINVAEISSAEISATLKDMLGVLRLPVSAYSAMKRGGKPMYKHAREAEKEGKQVAVVPIRDMEVHKVELLKVQNIAVDRDIQGIIERAVKKAIKNISTDTAINRSNKVIVKIRFVVGGGTYIRSLAEELGRRLGYPGTLKGLRRTKVGEFEIKDAKQLEDF